MPSSSPAVRSPSGRRDVIDLDLDSPRQAVLQGD